MEDYGLACGEELLGIETNHFKEKMCLMHIKLLSFSIYFIVIFIFHACI